jgi:hypothetical protein
VTERIAHAEARAARPEPSGNGEAEPADGVVAGTETESEEVRG